MDESHKEYLRGIIESSQTYQGWTLLIIAGTILTIINSEYIKPVRRRVRYIYLLFIPAWIYFIKSMINADNVANECIGIILLFDEELLRDIDKHYGFQLKFFKKGLVYLGVWLMLYLLIWVFTGVKHENSD